MSVFVSKNESARELEKVSAYREIESAGKSVRVSAREIHREREKECQGVSARDT